MSVHAQLTIEIARQLTPKLRPRYLALASERVVYEMPEEVAVTTRSAYPDVGVLAKERSREVPRAAAVVEPPLRLLAEIPEPVPHLSLEIRDVAHRLLVTSIEILSPTNKRRDGREEYLAKRRRILLSSAHLLEIDLLREGQRVPMRQALPPAEYFVLLSRAEARPLTEVWPVALEQPLPTVPVPLLSGDPDVTLDLQQAFGNVYDLGGYDLAADYRQPPETALPADKAAWVAERLAAVRS